MVKEEEEKPKIKTEDISISSNRKRWLEEAEGHCKCHCPHARKSKIQTDYEIDETLPDIPDDMVADTTGTEKGQKNTQPIAVVPTLEDELNSEESSSKT